MPVINISIKEGRTLEQKRKVAIGVTNILVDECDATRENVHVIINEINEDNWGRGGNLLSDIK
jgi:4-oxalocrotonate tautomerase|tara:strand:+ start:460 stop:648 length:189 start_codon:yes stop_codon:yes gene_type:complete